MKKDNFASIIKDKTLYLSHGGKCIKLFVDDDGSLQFQFPDDFQANHEEADTLIVLHASKVSGISKIRSSDTDVLVLLIALVKTLPAGSGIFLDYGTSNNRRMIDVCSIATQLEQSQPGLSQSLMAFHALTGCDFTSAFYRKGKVTPFTKLENDPDAVAALMSLYSTDVNVTGITKFICKLYGHDGEDINNARYQLFMDMTGGKKSPHKVKKVNCASLPPCEMSLKHHIKRVNYVSIMWDRATSREPTLGLSPQEYGWVVENEHYQPVWYKGSRLPGVQESTEVESSHSFDPDDLEAAYNADTDVEDEGDDNSPQIDDEYIWSSDSSDSDEDE